ncbi:PREDICTED: mediator of RNA polymerase II transcription subunit 8 [Tarenaya hassleriana]|uniref:mediator of RNA polymerase II transcription subunit 8 n=1 Tax=Tarenaya hassleriana TaxID=28532 RepID=UPI00053C55C0|nr:PREDICTED: mediator of RNA polymerase II transcription subunit 8 [Tarenaya hassleriana]XP_019056465.1 PREDICTED: mediator of RNA polymerase II transcription subunit 8 [Tarenaya hassleriana]
MEGGVGMTQPQLQQGQPPQAQPQAPVVVERLNQEVVQLLNLEAVKTRAMSLYKAISRILEDFDAYAQTNTIPKWQDILGQYSMVNLELFNIVEDVRKVSKAFVVHPKNVNAESAAVLPVMLSSKLLPEMESDDNSKREQLLHGVRNLPIPMQIESLKARIDMIATACENAEKVLADTRKAYGFGTRQGPTILPTLDKGQAAKIQEQENLLRAAVNYGEGTRLPGDQRQITTALPPHLADVLTVNDGGGNFTDSSGRSMPMKNALTMSSNSINSQGNLLQTSGVHLMGRSAASPSGPTGGSFDNTQSPLPYANSPRSGATMVNAPSPQQQTQQQQIQQQQRAKLLQLPQHQQQLLAQQQLRQSSMQGLGQMPSLHDLHGQAQQKFQTLHGQHQMPYSQPMGHQQFQARQLPTGHLQHGMAQGQLNPAMNRHLNQFSGTPNTGLFTTAQGTPSSQMIPNMSGTISSQTLHPRMQFGLSGVNQQRTHASQILGDQMFNMGATNTGGMMPIQQQQQQQPQSQMQQQQQQQQGGGGGFGSMQGNAQNLQPPNMVPLQNAQQNLQNLGGGQQMQQNPQ